MTIYDYLALSDEDQVAELWRNGKHIDNYKAIDCKFVLYALNKLFVELELCVLTDKILGKHSYKHGARMDKYVGEF